MPTTPDPITASAAAAAARRELAKGKYHRDDPGLVQRVLNWLGDHLDRVFSGTSGGNAALLVVILLIIVVVVALVRAGRPTRRITAPVGATEDDPLAPGAVDHRRRAEEFEAAGQRREALREWLRATVQTIEARGVLPPVPGRTGAVTARAAAALLPTSAQDLSAAMAAFDEVWFGHRETTAEDLALARRVSEQVRTARIRRPETVGAGEGGYQPPW